MSVLQIGTDKEVPDVMDKYADYQESFLEILIQSFWAEVYKPFCFILFFKIAFLVIVPFKKVW